MVKVEFLKNGKEWISELPVDTPLIEIYLDDEREITDDTLKFIPYGIEYVAFRMTHCSGMYRGPRKLNYNPEVLGKLNLKGVFFCFEVEGLETDYFLSKCDRLEYIGIGAHDSPILTDTNNLPKSVKYIILQGWGLVTRSDNIEEYIKKNNIKLTVYF